MNFGQDLLTFASIPRPDSPWFVGIIHKAAFDLVYFWPAAYKEPTRGDAFQSDVKPTHSLHTSESDLLNSVP